MNAFRSTMAVTAALLLVLSMTAPEPVPAQSMGMPSPNPWVSSPQSAGKTSFGVRPAFLWGYNDLFFRDGDNANIRPSKQQVTLNSFALGLTAERFFMSDLSVRAEGIVNFPDERRNDFVFHTPDGTAPTLMSWDTSARCVVADLSAVYYFGLGDSTLHAGLTAGYRYHDFNYDSSRAAAPVGTFHERIQVHVPYTGVYYADSSFRGTVLRLDVLWSGLTLALVQAERNMLGVPLRIDGNAITGFWFESLFSWSVPVSTRLQVGLFARYNYLELSGGATIKSGISSTRFSMDSRSHLVFAGLTAGFSF